MSEQMTFKRYEVKYLITKTQQQLIKNAMTQYMIADEHGKSTICSLYYDTPDFLLARRSMEHPLYKEKLRLRSYGVAKADSTVFIELKKKYESVVYKRRESMKEQELMKTLQNHKVNAENTQIMKEIKYCMKQYEGIQPAVMLTYEREAYYGENDHEFRMTFDENILWRDYDLTLHDGIYGEAVIPKGMVLLEVKTAGAIPKWLVDVFSKNRIYKTSFSKYGTAYKTILKTQLNGGIRTYA